MSGFLQLQARVDTGVRERPARSSCVTPSTLAKLMGAENFTSVVSPSSAAAPGQKKPAAFSPTPALSVAHGATTTNAPSTAGGIEYRSSLNLKWNAGVSSSSGGGGTTFSGPQPAGPRTAAEDKEEVFWRECKMEAFVRREAIFYNFLMTKSDGGGGTGGAGGSSSTAASAGSPQRMLMMSHSSAGSPVASPSPNSLANKWDPEVEPPQQDQPSHFSLLWDVSRIAASSHLLGGNGSFFLRREFMSEDGSSGVLPPNSTALETTTAEVPISLKHVLKLFGNERTYNVMPTNSPSGSVGSSGTSTQHQHRSHLHRATSYLVTESFDRTVGEVLRKHGHRLDAVQLCSWCRQISFQLAEMHRAGVIHNNIHADSIALCVEKKDEDEVDDGDDGDDCNSALDEEGPMFRSAFFDETGSSTSGESHLLAKSKTSRATSVSSQGNPEQGSVTNNKNDSRGATTGAKAGRNPGVSAAALAKRRGRKLETLTTVKISWLYCATMSNLQVVRGLRKQTLSQSRSDPTHSEYHTLQTAHLPESLTQLAKTYPSVLPPEWFAQHTAKDVDGGGRGGSGSGEPGSATTGGGTYLKLRTTVIPTEATDAYLFGKLLQLIFTDTRVPFHPQSVVSVSQYYLSKTAQASFADCPSQLGKLQRIDEVNAECLRHLIVATTMDDIAVRWTMREACCHPFFWEADTILEFLKCVKEFSFPPPQIPTHGSAAVATATTGFARRATSAASERPSLREAFREIAIKAQPQSTKKSNITAPELASLKSISKQLSSWVVEPRMWMTTELSPWFEALSLESRNHGQIRSLYENLVHQQVEFLIEVHEYMRDRRPIPVIVDGDPLRFFQVFLHRMFPTLLMEAVSMTMNEEDAPKFARFLASKLRMGFTTPPRARRMSAVNPKQVTHIRTILTVVEAMCREKGKTLHAAGYDSIVQYVGSFPQFPVHVPESEKVQVVKKVINKPRGKPSISHLPKWAQEQIMASDI